MPNVSLSRHQLLLLDWVLKHPAPTQAPDLGWHSYWQALRLEIWRNLYRIDKTKNMLGKQILGAVWLDEEEAAALLSLVPTTFRWGAGNEDAGYELNMALYRALRKETVDGSKDETQGIASDMAKGESEAPFRTGEAVP